MITFKDILKANGKFFFVLIICALLFLAIILGVKYESNVYDASLTYFFKHDVTQEDGTVKKMDATSGEVNQIYSVINEITNSTSFYKILSEKLQNKYGYDDSEASEEILKDSLTVTHKSGELFIGINFKGKTESQVQTMLNESSKAIFDKYKSTTTNSFEYDNLYDMSIKKLQNQNVKFALIGILVGLVVGELIIVCYVFANPYVDDENILARSTELRILSSFDKVKGEKK